MTQSEKTTARIATYACYAAFLALGASATMLGPAYEALSKKFGMQVQDAGILTAAQFLGGVIGILIAGRLLERLNARTILMGGALLMGTGWLLLSFAQTLPLALLSIVFFGLGFGALDVGPNTTVIALNPTRASIASNTLNVWFGFGAIAGPQIVNFGLGAGRSVDTSFVAIGLFTLALLIPLVFVNVRVVTRGAGTKARINWAIIFPFAALVWLYVGAESGFGSWLFTQMRRMAGSTEGIAALAASLFWGGVTASRLSASVLLRRFSNYQIVAGSCVIIMAGAALILAVPTSETLSLVAAFIVGFGCGPVFPTVFSTGTELYPQSRGTVGAIIGALGTSGAIFIPPLQGWIAGQRDGSMVVTLVTAGLMLGVLWWVSRTAPGSRLPGSASQVEQTTFGR